MTPQQLEQHLQAAHKLNQIMNAAFMFIRHNLDEVDEFAVKKFIITRLKANNLLSETDNPIVAFGPNTAHVHYYVEPESSRKLQEGDLILIDLWARLNALHAPFADITWMGFAGDRLGEELQQRYNILTEARDLAIRYIQKSLKDGAIPIAGEIDKAIRVFFERHNLHRHFLHTTGHPLGTTSAYGRSGGAIWIKNNKPLVINIPYTIEPGLYFNGLYGFRSEIDFYINNERELVISADLQTGIELV